MQQTRLIQRTRPVHRKPLSAGFPALSIGTYFSVCGGRDDGERRCFYFAVRFVYSSGFCQHPNTVASGTYYGVTCSRIALYNLLQGGARDYSRTTANRLNVSPRNYVNYVRWNVPLGRYRQHFYGGIDDTVLEGPFDSTQLDVALGSLLFMSMVSTACSKQAAISWQD
jgi:hypothetical protein